MLVKLEQLHGSRDASSHAHLPLHPTPPQTYLLLRWQWPPSLLEVLASASACRGPASAWPCSPGDPPLTGVPALSSASPNANTSAMLLPQGLAGLTLETLESLTSMYPVASRMALLSVAEKRHWKKAQSNAIATKLATTNSLTGVQRLCCGRLIRQQQAAPQQYPHTTVQRCVWGSMTQWERRKESRKLHKLTAPTLGPINRLVASRPRSVQQKTSWKRQVTLMAVQRRRVPLIFSAPPSFLRTSVVLDCSGNTDQKLGTAITL